MFEYEKKNYIIISDNHELSKDVLNWFPSSVYSIIVPQMQYFTCRYYKFMNDPFSEEYMYKQSIKGNILAWGMRTIMPVEPQKPTTSKDTIIHKKQQYIAVCLKHVNTNPLLTSYNNLVEEQLDIPLNYYMVRQLIINISTFETTCISCKKYCIQMKIKYNHTLNSINAKNNEIGNISNDVVTLNKLNISVVCTNQLCERSMIDSNKLALDQGKVLIEYCDLQNYYNPNIRYYCNICFRCKVCTKLKVKNPTAYCKKHLICKHRTCKPKQPFKNKLKSLKTFIR